MIYLRRIFMVSAAVVAVTIQGCGCDDNDKYYPPPQEQTFSVTGTAGKGILRNFDVSAYRFTNGVLDPTPIVSSTTSNLGVYSLNIPQLYSLQPLLYRVTPKPSGSIMTCDLSDGCGDSVAFGGDLPVTDTSFRLDSVVPSAGDNPVANISVFTDLASSLALQAGAASNEAIRTAIARSNSQVANRFGITGSLFKIPVIDLTNRAAVEAALTAGNARYVQYAAMNSAIAQAAWADSETGLWSGLGAFRNYFVGGGIPGNTAMTGVTSYAEILNAAQNILQRVSAINPNMPLNVAALLQNLAAERELANSEQPDERDPGTPSEIPDGTPLQIVKAMVKDLRNLAVSIGDTSLTGGTIGAISEDFAMQLEAAEMASSEEAGHLINAMAIAAAAIDDANRAHGNNAQLTSYTSDTGVQVNIAVEGEATRFSVDQDIEVPTDGGDLTVAVELNAVNDLTYSEAPADTSANGIYELAGTAASTTLSMKILDGSSIEITDMAVVEANNEEAALVTETHSLESFDLNLMVELSQLGVTDAVTVKGTLTASLGETLIVDAESAGTGTSTITAGLLSMKLSGVVSNSTGESANFVVTVSGDGTGVSFVETWSNEGEASVGETEANYADLYGNLAFTAKLTGIPNTVSLNFSVARTGIEDAENTLTIRYPGKQFRFHMLVADGAPDGNLTVTNQDGVVMSVLEDEEGLLRGNISLNGTQYATIEEDTTVTIRYSDESFESL